MMKRWFSLACALLIVTLSASAASGFDMTADGAPEESLRLYEDKGEVVYAVREEAGARIAAKGYYGYHMEENPSMTVGVCLDAEGAIERVYLLDSEAQTPGFAEMITERYLEEAYSGVKADGVTSVDVVSGATATSTAVNYAVRAALDYARQAYGLGGNGDVAALEELNQFYPGDYVAINTDYETDAKKYGKVLFAAEDGRSVVMKVESSKKVNYKHSSDTGWPSAEPSPYTMLIAIDKATGRVAAWRVLVDGTKRPEYFTVPEEKYDAYKAVEITDETVFDEFADGLVYDLDVETEKDAQGFPVITGTSIIYTGASDDGTFSSQLVRRCFQTAARFYCNYM